MTARPPIPLSSPGGIVYAWACGQCLRVGGSGTMLRDYDMEIVACMAEASRADAARCCVCEVCGCGLVEKWRKPLERPLHMCPECWPSYAGREAARRAELPPVVYDDDEGSLCPMCGRSEDE